MSSRNDSSRVFAVRLSKDSEDPNHVNARHIMDEIWDKSKSFKKDFMIKAINLGAENEIIEPSEFVRNLNELSENLQITQANQFELIQDLRLQIDNLETERALIRTLLSKMKSADFTLYEQATHEVIDESEDVNDDLRDSLLGLLG